jgi:hypothetical protein
MNRDERRKAKATTRLKVTRAYPLRRAAFSVRSIT